MAFGFTPKFEQDLDLNDLDPKHYLAIALIVAEKLEWRINYTSKSGFIAIIGGGLFTTMEQFQVSLHDAKAFIVSKTVSQGMFDWGKNKKHIQEFIDTFSEVQSSLSEQQLNEKLTELAPVFDSTEEDKLALPPPNFNDNLKSFFSLFTPRENYFVTPILIDINFLVFLLMVASGVSFFEPTIGDLLKWGANLRALTLEGQSWRLLTNIFLHIGIFHIVLNMYALMYIGLVLEPYLGKARFIAAYLFTGIIASLSSIYWHTNIVSAGASGAIFGMYGVFLAMLTTNFIDKSSRKPLIISIGVFVVYNLMNGLKGGIDNAAHIGGLISGLLIGYSYYPSLKKPESPKLKYVTIAVLAVVVLFSSFTIYHAIPNDFAKYDVGMKDFGKNENTALSVYKLPNNSTNASLIIAFQDSGIVYWNKDLEILKEMDKLDLPLEYTLRIYRLRRYCNLRIEVYNYQIKDINENTQKYKPALDSCNTQIKAVLDTLNQQD